MDLHVLEEFLKQSPVLTILVVLVLAFFKFVGRQEDKTNALFEKMHAENMEARLHSRNVIEQNTKAMATNSETLEHHADAIKDLTEVLNENLYNGNKR